MTSKLGIQPPISRRALADFLLTYLRADRCLQFCIQNAGTNASFESFVRKKEKKFVHLIEHILMCLFVDALF